MERQIKLLKILYHDITEELNQFVKQSNIQNGQLTIATNNNSSLAKLADNIVAIPINVVQLNQPMGSTFEQLSLLTYDSIIYSLMEDLNQTPESMKNRHANIE